MSHLTEQEQVSQHQHFAYKMRNLYLNDRNLFEQLQDYVPYAVRINRQDNLDIIKANDKILFKGPEMEKLVETGSSYLKEISCPILLERSMTIANRFKSEKDTDSYYAHLQQLRLDKKMTYFLFH